MTSPSLPDYVRGATTPVNEPVGAELRTVAPAGIPTPGSLRPTAPYPMPSPPGSSLADRKHTFELDGQVSNEEASEVLDFVLAGCFRRQLPDEPGLHGSVTIVRVSQDEFLVTASLEYSWKTFRLTRLTDRPDSCAFEVELVSTEGA